MSIKVRPATDAEIEKWNTYVERSNQGTIFHRYEWLQTAEKHSSATLHTYVAVKGESIRGLFPFYTMQKGPFSIVFSPLPETQIPYLGPILLLDPNIKQRKREKANKQFIDGWLKEVETEFSPSYITVSTVPSYQDIRPFLWQTFSNSTSYTYRINLSDGEQTALKQFSGDARSSIKNSDEDSYSISVGDKKTIERVYMHITRRYEEQSRSYPLTKAYLLDVYATLPDNFIRIYEGQVNDEPVSGRISLFGYESSYLWQGSPKPASNITIPINDLINWRTIQDSIKRNISVCDQVGANTYRICRYKSKFNPELVNYHRLTRGSIPAKLAKQAYQIIRNK